MQPMGVPHFRDVIIQYTSLATSPSLDLHTTLHRTVTHIHSFTHSIPHSHSETTSHHATAQTFVILKKAPQIQQKIFRFDSDRVWSISSSLGSMW